MLPLRYAHRWKLASAALLFLIFVVTIVPSRWLWLGAAGGVPLIPGADKWAHGLAFLFLTLWFIGLYQRRSYWWIALGLAGFGAFIEISQKFVGFRSAEWADFAADIVGIVIGLVVARYVGIGGWCERVERRYAPIRPGTYGD